MARKDRAAIGLIAVLVLVQWALLSGGGLLHAQSQPTPREPAYQYVGVDQTIARVETATGRVEILAKPGETRASLLIPDRRPWKWRDVPIEEKRPHIRGLAPRGEREDDPAGPRGGRPDDPGDE